MRPQSIEAEKITGHQKLVDLATAIFQEIYNTNVAAEDPVATIRFVTLTVNLSVAVNRYGCSELLQQSELIAKCRPKSGSGDRAPGGIAKALLGGLHPDPPRQCSTLGCTDRIRGGKFGNSRTGLYVLAISLE
jgi:hypothetical protein